MINSRKIDDLLPHVAIKCRAFISACKAQGSEILITSTYRDIESQNALYAQGRTTVGKKVTNARGGYSYHNYRVAFDFVPMINGKPNWTGIGLFKKCGEIGESVGLEWAGRWKSFKEMTHMQDTGGKTLVQLRAGK